MGIFDQFTHQRQDQAQEPATEFQRCLKAAQQGDADAQYDLGVRYATGKGVGLDQAEATRWYRKAAEQGDADAQYNLAVNYVNGDGGLTRDLAKAEKWAERSLKNGKKNAQELLMKIRNARRGRR